MADVANGINKDIFSADGHADVSLLFTHAASCNSDGMSRHALLQRPSVLHKAIHGGSVAWLAVFLDKVVIGRLTRALLPGSQRLKS